MAIFTPDPRWLNKQIERGLMLSAGNGTGEVTRFHPLVNSTFNTSCEAIYAYESLRPDVSNAFMITNLVLFGISMVMWSVSLVFFWVFRKHETIRTSRPFSAQFIMVVSNVVLSCSFTLNSAFPGRFPCTLFASGIILGLGGCVVHFYTLIVFFLLQSHFARDAARDVGTRVSKTTQSPTSSVNVNSHVHRNRSSSLLERHPIPSHCRNKNQADKTISSSNNNTPSSALPQATSGEARQPPVSSGATTFDYDTKATSATHGRSVKFSSSDVDRLLSDPEGRLEIEDDRMMTNSTTSGGSSEKSRQKATQSAPDSFVVYASRMREQRGSNEYIRIWFTLFSILLGRTGLEELEAAHVKVIKHHYWLVFPTIVMVPSIVTFVVLIMVVDGFQNGCVGCSMYLEIFIAFLCHYVVYVVFAGRSVWILRAAKFQDGFGILSRLYIVLTFGNPIAIIFCATYIVDANSATFNRVFLHFEWGWFIIMHSIYWYAFVGLSMWDVGAWSRHDLEHDSRSNTLNSAKDQTIGSRSNTWSRFMKDVDGHGGDRFQIFMINRLAVESLLFVRSVSAYKRGFPDRNPAWRIHHAFILLDGFVRVGSDLEVNVSYDERIVLLNKVEQIDEQNTRDLFTAFDAICESISSEILYPNWIAYRSADIREARQTIIKHKDWSFVSSRTVAGRVSDRSTSSRFNTRRDAPEIVLGDMSHDHRETLHARFHDQSNQEAIPHQLQHQRPKAIPTESRSECDGDDRVTKTLRDCEVFLQHPELEVACSKLPTESIARMWYPGIIPEREFAVSLFLCTFFLYDDVLEHVIGGEPEVDKLIKALSGDCTDVLMRDHRSFVRAIACVGRELFPLQTDSFLAQPPPEDWKLQFLTGIRDFLNTLAEEQILRIRALSMSPGTVLPLNQYNAWRMVNVGGNEVGLLVEYAYDNYLDRSQLDMVLVNRVRLRCTEWMMLENDLASFISKRDNVLFNHVHLNWIAHQANRRTPTTSPSSTRLFRTQNSSTYDTEEEEKLDESEEDDVEDITGNRHRELAGKTECEEMIELELGTIRSIKAQLSDTLLETSRDKTPGSAKLGEWVFGMIRVFTGVQEFHHLAARYKADRGSV